ncbi:hypothetical protein D3C79_961650 [compost metagenome]
MPQCMARYADDLERQAQHADFIAVCQCGVAGGNLLVGRAVDLGAGQLLEPFDTADMVVVMVGHEDVAQYPVGVGRQPTFHWAGVAGVDHRATAFGSIL